MARAGWWNWDGWPAAEEWQAWWAFVGLIPAIVAGVAAIFAVWIALRQFREVIRSNDELRLANDEATKANLAVSRPYVTVDLEAIKQETRNASLPLTGTLRVVIQNDGRSPAKNVRLTVSPPFRAGWLNFLEGGEKRHHDNLDDTFSGRVVYSMMRPGRRYSLLLDELPEALTSDTTPREYKVTVKYSTIDGQHEFEDSYTLNLEVLGPALLETDVLRRISKDIQGLTAEVAKLKKK